MRARRINGLVFWVTLGLGLMYLGLGQERSYKYIGIEWWRGISTVAVT